MLTLTAGVTACAHGGGRAKGPVVHLAGLSSQQVDQALMPRKVALLVGIDGYEDPFWPDLRFAAKDARDLARVLADPARGGFDEVRILTRPEETDPDELIRAVEELAQLAPRSTDTVVIYLSGHGTLAPSPTGSFERVLVTGTTRHDDLRGTGLRVDRLLEAYEALPSRRKALVLATCHSGGGKGLLTPQIKQSLESLKGSPPIERVSRASMVFSAADIGQAAREDDVLQNDVYTHFLIEALVKGADANGDGAVSATEAHDHARRRTFEYTGGLQTPAVRSTVVGADPVVLAGRLTGPGMPVVYSYATGLEGYQLRVDGRAKGSLPGQIVLPAGRHQVELARRGHPTLGLGQVRLHPGDRLAVEGLLRDREPLWRVGLSGGVLALTSRRIARETVRPLPSLGLFAERRHALGEAWTLRADLSVGRATQTTHPAGTLQQQTVRTLSLGAGILRELELGTRVVVQAGPHLTLASFTRTFELPELHERQSLITVLPGLLGSVRLHLANFEVGLSAELHYLPLVLDGSVRSTATGVAALTFGRSF